MRVKRGLKGRNQPLKLVEGQAGPIQELRGTGLYIEKPSAGHRGYLLFLEAQYTTNRDKLNHTRKKAG